MLNKTLSRGNFIKTSGLSLAATLIGGPSFIYGINSNRNENLTIQQVVDLMIGSIGGDLLRDTVDTIKIGDPTMKCSGVVSTFLPTAEIIQETANLGANLIVTHEPTFYNHRDKVDWLEGDPVYEFKRELLEKNNIVVFRFHDYWHKHEPDGILHGLLKEIGWTNYLQKTIRNTGICIIPETSLKDLGHFFEEKLDLKRPAIVGNPNLRCRQIGFLAGSWGGRSQMRMLQEEEIEVLVVGEVDEWETSEYVRDATFAGMKKGLVILGHAPSEGPGMEYLVKWLQPKIPEIPVYYEHTTDAFIPVD